MEDECAPDGVRRSSPDAAMEQEKNRLDEWRPVLRSVSPPPVLPPVCSPDILASRRRFARWPQYKVRSLTYCTDREKELKSRAKLKVYTAVRARPRVIRVFLVGDSGACRARVARERQEVSKGTQVDA